MQGEHAGAMRVCGGQCQRVWVLGLAPLPCLACRGVPCGSAHTGNGTAPTEPAAPAAQTMSGLPGVRAAGHKPSAMVLWCHAAAVPQCHGVPVPRCRTGCCWEVRLGMLTTMGNPRGEHWAPHWGGRGGCLTLSMPRDKISLPYVRCMKTGIGAGWAAGPCAG